MKNPSSYVAHSRSDSATRQAGNESRIAAAGRGKVRTHFWMKPIPMRQFDWCATFDNDEPNDNGQMLHGYGATEAEAIEELLTNYEDGL